MRTGPVTVIEWKKDKKRPRRNGTGRTSNVIMMTITSILDAKKPVIGFH